MVAFKEAAIPVQGHMFPYFSLSVSRCCLLLPCESMPLSVSKWIKPCFSMCYCIIGDCGRGDAPCSFPLYDCDPRHQCALTLPQRLFLPSTSGKMIILSFVQLLVSRFSPQSPTDFKIHERQSSACLVRPNCPGTDTVPGTQLVDAKYILFE